MRLNEHSRSRLNPKGKTAPLMKNPLSLLAATAVAACVLGVGHIATAQTTMSAISEKMTGVAGELARPDTGTTVQERQKRVVRDLDEVIGSLERECENCRGGMKRNNPKNGMNDSMISRGTGGIGSPGGPHPREKGGATPPG